MRWIFWIYIISTFAIGGCAKYAPETLLPDEANTVSAQLVDLFIAHDFEGIKPFASDAFLAIENIETGVLPVFEYFDVDTTNHPSLVYTEIRKSDTSQTAYPLYLSQYELERESDFLLIDIYVSANPDCCKLHNINVRPSATRPSAINNFTLKEKSAWHYVFLAGLILVPLFIIYTLVACVRDKQLKRKWLWFLFILVGIYGINLNWTTGEIGNEFFSHTGTGSLHISLISFQILGAGFIKSSIFGAWTLTVAFPLGAVIYWFRRKTRNRKAADVF